MADSIYKWSLTAAQNDQADSAVNWRENQLPDTVNDSARSMMMRIAELREDLTGGLLTAGTQPAYTLTTKAAFDSLADGRHMTARVHATNAAGAATLNVNALGAKSIRKFGTSGDMALGVGDLQLGGLYQFMYASTANAGAGGWIISNPSISTGGGFASGTQMLFMNAAAPVGWTKQTTHDNKALRIVSGTGGATGGSATFTAAFASRTPTGTVDGHVLTIGELAAHTHTQQGSVTSGGASANHYHNVAGGTGGYSTAHTHANTLNGRQYVEIVGNGGGQGVNGAGMGGVTNTNWSDRDHSHNFNVNSGYWSADHTHATTLSGATTSTGSGTAHVHPWTGAAMDFAVAYVDSIICTKD